MKKLLFPLLFICHLISVSAQEGYGPVDPGEKGLAIGDKQNYSRSSFVINGPCIPYYEDNYRDIVFKFDSSGKSVIRAYRGDSWGNFLQFLTTGPNSTDATPIVRMHLDQHGNVGIGTVSPQERLDVSGTIRSNKVSVDDVKLSGKIGRGLIYPFIYDNVQMDNFSLSWVNDPQVHADNGYTLWMSSFGGMKFFTQQQPRLTIEASGNVGIGITNPQNKLDVNGTIKAKEIKVESGWADYVFKKDYILPPLEEVEIHILEKGILPDIPSETQIKKDGVNLGEMNTLLLQKIEELTLYTIQQQKLIDNIKRELEELKSNINH